MKPSDLFTTTHQGGSSRSPGRNSDHRGHQSIDDSHLNYHHGQSTSTDPGNIVFNNRTTDPGFYRVGKTAGESRINSRIRAGYATSTTNPGSSVDEVNLGAHPTDLKSPNHRLQQHSHRERNQKSSDEPLPQLTSKR